MKDLLSAWTDFRCYEKKKHEWITSSREEHADSENKVVQFLLRHEPRSTTLSACGMFAARLSDRTEGQRLIRGDPESKMAIRRNCNTQQQMSPIFRCPGLELFVEKKHTSEQYIHTP